MVKKKTEVRMASTYNMAEKQMENINSLEQHAHDCYLKSDTDPWMLYRSAESLFRAYLIFRVSLAKGTRKKMDDKFDDMIEKTRDNRHLKKLTDEYYKLRDGVTDLTKLYFEAKQAAGVHLLIEKIKDSELLMEEMTQA